ncbi:MAG: hypothetical protein IV104_13330 [Acidovorax sp.]|nr:hypothetical protein [Acidovorax sp.]
MTDKTDMPEGITRDDTVHGETYFTAANMATAWANGFRDGVASLAANAGEPTPPVAPPMDGEIALIEKALESVGITSLLNHGAASCVFTEGCCGVSQEHILAYTRKIALHCAVALAAPPTAQAEGWTKASKQLPPCRDDQLYIGINTAGFAGVFNAVRVVNGNTYCLMEVAEESVSIMSDLDIWKLFNPPTSAEGVEHG